ncbi:uncharacterized protein, MTH1187 family [Alteribacillus persepolensis]|uniref:Uncharacterized protein, MTH1187 family n=1 Tax=Alteribacillus persepolensis TaxID=568899 RepID=A0A1G8CWE1_9BACI|nr:MTH1187 family thiamine-binding protein [Alteribacillus persepolensis]SDH49805.1 uncharacterized protein, MTH1187 family [Alteribacillus persepolensis]
MKGLSYQNGVIFFGNEYIGWGRLNRHQKPESFVLPLNGKTVWTIVWHVFLSMPLWYLVLFFLWTAGVFVSAVLDGLNIEHVRIPFYTFIYFLLGTHFIFPEQLKKFHGAEHKVFSYRGPKKRSSWPRIKKAAITNRYCSTNIVVLYFLIVMMAVCALFPWFSLDRLLPFVSYGALFVVPIVHRVLQTKKMGFLRKPVLVVSYFLQRYITCAPPERIHLLTAVDAYRALSQKEFPHLLQTNKPKKEEKQMAIMDVTIVPVGTNSPGMSENVAEMQEVLKRYEARVDYELTPMSTIIEGNLDDLFAITKELHEVPFQKGVDRVATNIRIDDRRDKGRKGMKEKMQSVKNKQKQD